MQIKLQNYNVLKTTAPETAEVAALSTSFDQSVNDRNDTLLLNELYSDRVDALITEDRGIHSKARVLGIDDRVFTIDDFLEKVTAENPSLAEYKVPSVTKEYFGNIDLSDSFFDSFREDYKEFSRWFNRKADEIAYVCRAGNRIVGFLYLKPEGRSEPYQDIYPTFQPGRRLKIGTFKVALNGYKIGERFLKIVFDNALQFGVDETYVTIFPDRIEQQRLIYLLCDYGFASYGTKHNSSGTEEVYVRSFARYADREHPRTTFPFMSRKSRKFIVPIYPKYHTALFPDSILRTESPFDFVEQEPFRNAISKVYVSRSYEKQLKTGDIILFYRTGGYYKGVATTLGIVENVVTDIHDLEHFKRLCRKRSVFTDKELSEQWEYYPRHHPFVVNFLYAYSLPRRPNLKNLIDMGVILDIHSVPRGFKLITDEEFQSVMQSSEANESVIVD